MRQWISKDPSDLPGIAADLLPLLLKASIVAFYGEMGAGKTTFINALCKEAGVVETTSSPTFSIVNEYHSNNGTKIYHFDFYRIRSEEEAYDFGYEEYFYSGHLCFVEWPEKISNLLPSETVNIRIEKEENSRLITLLP